MSLSNGTSPFKRAMKKGGENNLQLICEDRNETIKWCFDC